LKFCHENGCPWDKEVCINAAESGVIECLTYACIFSFCSPHPPLSSCSLSLLSNCFSFNRYAHENGCTWDAEVCRIAAINRHLECLKYAHENGCEWDKEKMCENAIIGGSVGCLKYVHIIFIF
jgi:hypothetical protein